MSPLSSSDVCARLWDAFPELRDDLAEDDSLLHLQFDHLARHTQHAITSGDLATVRRDFMFMDRVLADGDEYVKNAVHVSYLEHVAFTGEHGPAAERLLSTRLRQGWERINQRHSSEALSAAKQRGAWHS